MTDNSRPLLWRQPLQAIQDGVLNSVGYPATLRRRIDNGALEIKTTAAGHYLVAFNCQLAQMVRP